MKLFRILPLVVGSAAAGILASTAPAQALNWDWSYSAPDITASGTYTTTDTPINGYYTITGITGTRNGFNITGLVSPGEGNVNVYPGNDLKLTLLGLPSSDGISFLVDATPFGEVNLYGNGEVVNESLDNFNSIEVSYLSTAVSEPEQVPFDIPGGATIPALGGLLALGAMRKVRHRIASKTRIAKESYCEG